MKMIMSWGNTDLGGTNTPNLILVDEETKGSNKDAWLTWQVQGWEGRGGLNASYLLPSCRKAVRGLAQPALHVLFPPWKWEKFPMQLDWPDLQAEHSHLFQEAFFLMQHPEQSG